jgi:hypothetical protein
MPPLWSQSLVRVNRDQGFGIADRTLTELLGDGLHRETSRARKLLNALFIRGEESQSLLRSGVCVVRRLFDAGEEELDPRLPVSALPRPLKELVVPLPMLAEVQAEVEQRFGLRQEFLVGPAPI